MIGSLHVDVRGSHIDLGTEYLLSVRVFAVLHFLKQLQVFLHGAVSVRTVPYRVLSKFRGIPGSLPASGRRHNAFPFLMSLTAYLIHLFKIVGCKEQSVLPVSAQPLDIVLDGLHKLHLLLGGVRIIKTHVEFAVIFLWPVHSSEEWTLHVRYEDSRWAPAGTGYWIMVIYSLLPNPYL